MSDRLENIQKNNGQSVAVPLKLSKLSLTITVVLNEMRCFLLLNLNTLAGQYTGRLITVVGVFKATLPMHSVFHPYTSEHLTPSSGFVFIGRGNGSFICNGTTYDLHPGKVLHGGEHMTISMSTQNSELAYTLVRYRIDDPETKQDASTTFGTNEHFTLEPGTNPKIAELMTQLYDSFYTPGNMALIRTGYLFQMTVYELFSSCLNRLNSNSKEMIEEAKAYIHNHYMEPLSLQKLAERHGTSAKSFSYYFKKYTGVFPIDYVIQHRMKRAQEQLSTDSRYVHQRISCKARCRSENLGASRGKRENRVVSDAVEEIIYLLERFKDGDLLREAGLQAF